MKKSLIDQLSPITEEEKEYLAGKTDIDYFRYMDSRMVVKASKFLDNGQLIKIRTHARFIHFPKHTHDYIEVVYMCTGTTHHLINNEPIDLHEGELLFLNQNSAQEILPAGKDDIAVNFIIRPEFFDVTLKMLADEETPLRDFIVGCLTKKETNVNYLHFAVADILPIQNLVENLVWTLQNAQSNKRSINQTTMGLLFLQLLNYSDRVSVGANRFSERLTLEIYRYIEERYRDGSLADIAAKEKASLCSMSRLIKKLTGKTFTMLIQEKRLSQAAFLLKNTTLPVTDIGNDVGYENLSYFHRIFIDKYGMNPFRYRHTN